MKREREEGEDNNLNLPSVEHKSDMPLIFTCNIPPHCSRDPLTFQDRDTFERHYYKYHGINCSICHAVFPYQLMLELHIIENHDSYSQARRARGDKIYGCLVEGCDKVCSDKKKRRRHVIDKHGYPEEFDFRVIDRGVGRHQTSLLSSTSEIRAQRS